MKTGANQLQTWLKKYRHVSEAAMAVTFADDRSEQWRYNTDEGVWLQWVGTHWARRQTPEMLDALRYFLVAFTTALQSVAIITNAEAIKLQSQRAISAVERICRSTPTFLARASQFDSDPFALGTPGGTIDMRTGEMRAANPADHITVLTPVTPAPPGTPYPRWQAFLDEVTNNNRDLQRTLQQFAGISACGTSRDQKILFLYGYGGNGKGVYLRTIAGLLGEHAVNAPRDLLMVQKSSQHPTALVDVVNARMVMATEIDEDATWDTALIKDLTGGDLISVRRMRQDFYRAIAKCSITISGNRKPALKEVDEAVRRRFMIATFWLKIVKVIFDLEKEFIQEEGPAILRWIIDGAVDRESAGSLYVAQVIIDDTEDYLAEENVMADFISGYLIPAPADADPIWRVKTSDVYASWKAYCGQSGRPFGARNAFTTAMKAAGVTYERTMDGRYFLNVHLRITPFSSE